MQRGTDADIDFGTDNDNAKARGRRCCCGECQLALLKLKIPLQWVDRKMKHIRLGQVEAFKSDTHFSRRREHSTAGIAYRCGCLYACFRVL